MLVMCSLKGQSQVVEALVAQNVDNVKVGHDAETLLNAMEDNVDKVTLVACTNMMDNVDEDIARWWRRNSLIGIMFPLLFFFIQVCSLLRGTKPGTLILLLEIKNGEITQRRDNLINLLNSNTYSSLTFSQ
ncbi:hypothetical protein V6N12_017745 [Hibiscus sabdariffa]|uniref:Uncharacterized protein n=1 Tax=Hibiscus sabdariffa TaxID=183260 RepID=A0ABR1ZIC5_9ROSI